MSSMTWLLLNVGSIVVLGFFSMIEMAIVSLNRIRLQFLLTQGSHRATMLNNLISNPSRLFGTTLIGVNVAMMLGSEFAREFNTSIGIDPDWAPLSQVLLVIIFGEIAPQFAARRYSEHVALLGAPILYYSSKIMAPFVYVLGVISRAANRLLGGKEKHQDLFLTLEELQMVLEDKDDDKNIEKNEEMDKIVSKIFRMRNLTAKKAMNPIATAKTLPSNTTVGHLRKILKKRETYIPIYHNAPSNIVGIVFLRDLVRATDTKKLRDFAESPWFITENTPLMDVLKQFRKNKAIVGCVIDDKGAPIGILSLDDILEKIFGKPTPSKSSRVIVDVTVSGDLTIDEFNREFHTHLYEENCETLTDLFLKKFEQHPEEGESLTYPPYELIVKECSLMDVKKVQVRTRH